MSPALPNPFNAAAYFVDRHIDEGRGARIAIECSDERVSYQQLFESVNRVGTALRDRLDVRPEERVLLLLTDTPAFAYAFFGAVKIGAVPVPLNTLWKSPEYAHVLPDTRARVLFVTDSLLPHIAALPAHDRQSLQHIIVVGQAAPELRSLDELIQEGSAALEPYPTSPDDTVVWLYSSGSTGPRRASTYITIWSSRPKRSGRAYCG
jgi:acyl-coenzyme A synthetase/AMP-(fatty) acid ligase